MLIREVVSELCHHRNAPQVSQTARGVSRRRTGLARRGAVALAAACVLAYAGNSAKAIDRNVYPTDHATTPWSFSQVNQYLDSANCASGQPYPGGETCPVAGDTVIFNGHADASPGIYIPPAGPPAQKYSLRTNNVNLVGNNAVLRGSQANSQILVGTYSEGNTISGFDLEGTSYNPKLWIAF